MLTIKISAHLKGLKKLPNLSTTNSIFSFVTRTYITKTHPFHYIQPKRLRQVLRLWLVLWRPWGSLHLFLAFHMMLKCVSAHCPAIAYWCNVQILRPFVLKKKFNQKLSGPMYMETKQKDPNLCSKLKKPTLTWVLGKAVVRRVSWVSSTILRFGMLNMKAAWSAVAAIDVILYPFSHLLCIPSLGYKKSSSTTFQRSLSY